MLSAFKNFGIAFLIAALIFGVIAFFATNYLDGVVSDIFSPSTNDLDNILHNNPTKTATTDLPVTAPVTGTETATEEEIKGESFNLLLVIVDDRNTELDYPDDAADLEQMIKNGDIDEEKLGVLGTDFHVARAVSTVLITADKEGKMYSFTPLSSIMRTFSGSGDIALGDFYAIYGIDGLLDKIPALTGINVDKYITVGISKLPEIADEFGSITFSVPSDVYNSENRYGSADLMREYENTTATTEVDDVTKPKPTLVLESGVQTIDGKKLVPLMLFEETGSATVSAKSSIVAGCAKSYFVMIAETETAELQARLQKFTDNELVSTNITKDWIDSNSGVIEAYSDFDRITLTYPSSFKSQTTEFGTRVFVIPNISAAVSAFVK